MLVIKVFHLVESYREASLKISSNYFRQDHMDLARKACFNSCIAKSLAASATRRLKLGFTNPNKRSSWPVHEVCVQDVLGRFFCECNARAFGFPQDAKLNKRIASSIMCRAALKYQEYSSDLFHLYPKRKVVKDAILRKVP